MKKVKSAAQAAFVLAVTMALAGGAFAGSGLPNPPAGGLAPRPGHGTGVHGEHHPVMRQAVDQLGRIKQMLTQDTEPESAGHRTQAILLIDQAIQQLQEGIGGTSHRAH